MIIAGARPNFMKVAPLCLEFKKRKLDYAVVNTGQHFSGSMSDAFLNEFGIKPDYTLKPEKSSVIKQFSDMMMGLEKIFKKENPALIIVVGDVNSTLVAALTANKMSIPLAHVEAGLRSFNRKMPEEINRIIVDQLADFLFVTEKEGEVNLKKEKVDGKIYFVGNIMIDTLCMVLPEIKESDEKFYFCTLHRAENVDNKEVFEDILSALEEISKNRKIYLPLHPRTKKMAHKFKLLGRMKKTFSLLPPLSYNESIFYQKNAELILTDSGGVQEEASFLGIPCLTLRTETERPITVDKGTNMIAGIRKENILRAYKKRDNLRKKTSIRYWDGKTSERIFKIINRLINK